MNIEAIDPASFEAAIPGLGALLKDAVDGGASVNFVSGVTPEQTEGWWTARTARVADGTITVLKAGATSPEVVAKNPPLGERIGATPAIADNTLYVRTAEHLYSFSEN